MYAFELKALTTMDRHQPHRIEIERRGWNLSQVALFGKKH
jgi:hypothetical protein